jgi:hypothetical protein
MTHATARTIIMLFYDAWGVAKMCYVVVAGPEDCSSLQWAGHKLHGSDQCWCWEAHGLELSLLPRMCICRMDHKCVTWSGPNCTPSHHVRAHRPNRLVNRLKLNTGKHRPTIERRWSPTIIMCARESRMCRYAELYPCHLVVRPS